MSSFAPSSPWPKRRTPSRSRRITPAATRAAASTGLPASSLPASIAWASRHRFTSTSFLANGLLKPRLGMRMCSGIWPPSKPPRATPERDFWPFTPRPAVLPLPEPGPRPTRRRLVWAPALSRISLSLVILRLAFLDLNHMSDFGDHAAHGRGVGQHRDAADAVQAKAGQRR